MGSSFDKLGLAVLDTRFYRWWFHFLFLITPMGFFWSTKWLGDPIPPPALPAHVFAYWKTKRLRGHAWSEPLHHFWQRVNDLLTCDILDGRGHGPACLVVSWHLKWSGWLVDRSQLEGEEDFISHALKIIWDRHSFHHNNLITFGYLLLKRVWKMWLASFEESCVKLFWRVVRLQWLPESFCIVYSWIPEFDMCDI